MRTVRLLLAGTVVVALLVELGGIAAGQAEADGTRSPTAPTEVTAASAPVAFTARMNMDTTVEPYRLEFLDDHVAYRGQIERWTVTEASDSRFSGDATIVASISNYQEPSDAWLARRVARIESADGAWQGQPTNEYWFSYRGLPFTMVFSGEGAYEGWTIVALATPSPGTQLTLDGLIIEGDFPSAPELPPE